MKDLYIAKTFAGLEDVLAQELRDLQIDEVEILNRAVSFKGDLKDLYTANYWCRTAIRILKPIADFPAEDELALYKGIRSIDWSLYMGLEDTFAIDATLSNSKINHSQYAALKTKDAIADQFVFKFNERPNVDTTRPTLRIGIFIQDDHCTVSLDTSNISLHKRGYRISAGTAPLNEVLAAGMILLSDWDKKSPFVDPMCGSGTLLIEAALIAMNIPPASYRDYFGFLNFKDFDAELWNTVKKDGLAQLRDIDFKIVGGDLASGMISVAEKNIQSAHLQKDIQIQQIAMQEFTPPPGPGIMICNPPYGERIVTHDIIDLYREMGDTMKQKYGGYTAWVISSDIIALKQIGLYPSRKIELYNGPLECRFEKFEIYEGSQKEKYLNLKSDDNSQEDRPKGPAYRRSDDWDKEGHATKFKGKTKSEWEIDSDMRNKNREPRKESGKSDRDTHGGRADRAKPSERTKYSKDSSPRRDYDRSDKDRAPKRDYDKSDRDRAPRREYDRSDKDRAPKRDYDKSDRDRAPRREYDRSDKDRAPKRDYDKSDRDRAPRREYDRSDKDRAPKRDYDKSDRDHAPRREYDRSDKDRAPKRDYDKSDRDRAPKRDYEKSDRDRAPKRDYDKSDRDRAPKRDYDKSDRDRAPIREYDRSDKDRAPKRDYDKSDRDRAPKRDYDKSDRDRAPKRDYEKSDRDSWGTDKESRDESINYSPYSKPRKALSDDDKRGDRSGHERSDDNSNYSNKDRSPRKESDKTNRDSREPRTYRKKAAEKTTFYPKGRAPRKRIPKKPDND